MSLILSIALSFGLTTIFVPVVIHLTKKYNWYDNVNPRKMHKGLVPRLGGFAMFLAYIISVIFYILTNKNNFQQEFCSVMPFFIGGLVIYIAGIIDDFTDLRARIKFVIQIIAALVICLSPMYFSRFLFWNIPPLAGRIITFFWILVIVNAYNLIDGLDWLCSGLSFLTLLTIGIMFYMTKIVTSELCFILCGAIAGFMIFNKPTAKIFLGDSGSQTLGFCIATLPLMNHMGTVEDIKPLLVLLLVSIPVTDVIAAIWRRVRDHRAIFSPDRAHIHHKLINIGFSKKAVIFFLLSFQFLICLAVISAFWQSRRASITILVVSIMFVETFFASIHYINRAVNVKFMGHLDAAPQEEH